MTPGEARTAAALADAGIDHTIVRHGPVTSLAEAAEAGGVTPDRVIKTLVVRRGDDDYLFVLVPGERQIAWPKLRAFLEVKRLSMPNAETAREVTGYERGTVTPFGSRNPGPVVADASVDETVSIGGGAHGVSATVAAADLIWGLNADIADVTDPL